MVVGRRAHVYTANTGIVTYLSTADAGGGMRTVRESLMTTKLHGIDRQTDRQTDIDHHVG